MINLQHLIVDLQLQCQHDEGNFEASDCLEIQIVHTVDLCEWVGCWHAFVSSRNTCSDHLSSCSYYFLCWLWCCWFLPQNKPVSDAAVVPPAEEQQADKLQPPTPPPKPTLSTVGPLKPLTGELPPHLSTCAGLFHTSCYLISPSFPSSCAAPPAVSDCNLCGGPSSVVCPSCTNQPFCDACDDLYHRHPSRANHKRDKIQKTKDGTSDQL